MGVCEIFILFVLNHGTIPIYEINQSPNIPRGGGGTTKAFTLIELLVVIAIIGILAAVVIASLNSARTKGRHAAIKSNLRNAVSQSNIYFNDNGTYTGLCSDPTIVSILSALGGSGSAGCHVRTSITQDIDFGIAATFDGTHFTADPSGVLQLDAANASGGSQSWDSAMASCTSIGKRTASGAALKALYDITSTTPSGLSASNYWSSTPHPTNIANAYGINMYLVGNLHDYDKSAARYVRCGS